MRRKPAAEVAPGSRRGRPPVLRRFKPGFRWSGTTLEPYKLRAVLPGEFRGASRQVLVGRGGEQVSFHVRYFELEPGGYTSLEAHRHCHFVMVLRGRGEVRVDRRKLQLGQFDCVYIGPGKPHQLRAMGRSGFGFLCMVDAQRDRPVPLFERARAGQENPGTQLYLPVKREPRKEESKRERRDR